MWLPVSYKAVFSTHDDRVIATINRSIEAALTELSNSASHLTDPDAIRAFLILLMNPLNGLPRRGSVLGRLCRCITALPSQAQGLLLHWIAVDVPPELFASRLVRRACVLRHVVPQAWCVWLTHHGNGAHTGASGTQALVRSPRHQHDAVRAPTVVVVHAAFPQQATWARVTDGVPQPHSQQRARHHPVCTVLCAPWPVLPAAHPRSPSRACGCACPSAQQYNFWQQRGARVAKAGPGVAFSLCEYPFLLNADAKRRILRMEAMAQQRASALRGVSVRRQGCACALRVHTFDSVGWFGACQQLGLLFPSSSPFLVLRVQRDNLIRSALTQLSSEDAVNLKKPLKVVFEGEEGIDEGGVAKEFFQLLIKEMFDLKYGMWTYDEETRHYWFVQGDEWNTHNYKLVGLVRGGRVCSAADVAALLGLPLAHLQLFTMHAAWSMCRSRAWRSTTA